MTVTQQKTLEELEKESIEQFKEKYPRLLVTPQYFNDLPEYDISFPTGTKIGKRFKRNFYVEPWGHITRPPYLTMIGEFIDIGSKIEVGIQWYIPKFRVKAVMGKTL